MNFILLLLGLATVNQTESAAGRAVGAAVLGVGLSRLLDDVDNSPPTPGKET